MKALMLRGPGDIRCETVPDPKPRTARDAIVRMTACSICGSDLHLLHGTMGGGGQISVGHEAIGEVVEIGSGVTRVKVGDKVLLPGSVGCGECKACHAGLVSACVRGVGVYGVGMPELDGCQAEAIAVPHADYNTMAIPEGLSDEQALTLTDSLPTAFLGVRNAAIKPGADVAIVGLGPIGLIAVDLAFLLGASRVFAIDPIPERRARAAASGATVLHPDDALATIAEATGGRLASSVVEVVGSEATVQLACHLAGHQGTVSVIGAGLNRADLPWQLAFMKGLTLRVSICSVQQHLPELTALVLAGRLKPEKHFTHRMALSDGAEAYRMFDKREDNVLKIVLTP